MDIEHEESILVLSALLHDIGKLVQRASKNFREKKHEEFGAEFLFGALNISDELKDEIIALVRSHHRIRYDGNYPHLLKILKDADTESARHDRDESEGIDENINVTPLLSVYSHVDIGIKEKKKVYYSLAPLEMRVNYPKELTSNSYQTYNIILKALADKLRKLPIKDKNDINTLLYLLFKYTKYVPSAIYVSVPDIPLYDHLKTTAAIALCQYRATEKNKYLLIMGDLSGIQNFIFYNLKGGEEQVVDEGGTKRMRGRSLLINLIIDSAVRYIIEKLELYEFNVLWESGGNFLILAPNKEGVEEQLEEVRKDVNEYLLDTFGRLYLNIGWLDVENLDDFSQTLERLHDKMDDVKSKKFLDFVRDESFYLKDSQGRYLCPVCGVHFVDSEGEICDICQRTKMLGEKIGKGDYLIRKIGEEGLFTFKYGEFEISYSVERELDGVEEAEVFSMENFEIPHKGKLRGFKAIKTHIPTVAGRVLSISELVSMNEKLEDRIAIQGPKGKLGIFKADVDCLGEIFAKGLKPESSSDKVSISRISTLSFLMDLFFTREINNLARDKNIYVIFSGGDDLTVVGRYDEVIEFAKEVNRKFREWVGYNPNLHISGSIVFFNEKFPIRRAVDVAEEELERVKSAYKNISRCVERGNKVAVFSHVLSWVEFEKQIELANELWQAQINREIPSSLSHVLLTLYRLSPEFYATQPISKGSVIIPSPAPYLKYYFARRRSEKSEELLRSLSDEDNFRHIPVGVSIWVMNRKYKGVKEK